jgi:fatty acid desaturase
MPSAAPVATAPTLNDPELLRQIHALRIPDNVTNWLYIAREYLWLALFVGGTIALCQGLVAWGYSWAWALPAIFAAILCIGAGHHRLATLGHEATHYALFRNRLLNELASDWFCMFPIFSGTHSFRIQHLGHHQYPNDPARDPDWAQLRQSGHRYRFPMTVPQFLWHGLFKHLLWPPSLVRYILVRATFVTDNGPDSPYRLKRGKAPLLKALGLAYHVVLIAVLAWAVWHEEVMLLLALPPGLLAMVLAIYAVVPAAWFPEFGIRADVPARITASLRLVFHTLLAISLAGLTLWTGWPWWLYYLVLWVVPLGTSFSLFMILRQLVQHGNADQGRLTNTRIFFVNPLISMAVFPMGMEWHLPHHLFPMVPHYNLRKVHELLSSVPEYQEHATIVEGYFLPAERPPRHPTVVDLMTH